MARRAKQTGGPAEVAPLATVVRIRALLPSLPPASRHVAEYVLADPAAVAGLTITELSEASGVSEASTLRFCRAIGFHGYPDLRLALATERRPRAPRAAVSAPRGGRTSPRPT